MAIHNTYFTIDEDDYINGVSGKAGGIWDRLEVTTSSGKHLF